MSVPDSASAPTRATHLLQLACREEVVDDPGQEVGDEIRLAGTDQRLEEARQQGCVRGVGKQRPQELGRHDLGDEPRELRERARVRERDDEADGLLEIAAREELIDEAGQELREQVGLPGTDDGTEDVRKKRAVRRVDEKRLERFGREELGDDGSDLIPLAGGRERIEDARHDRQDEGEVAPRDGALDDRDRVPRQARAEELGNDRLRGGEDARRQQRVDSTPRSRSESFATR